MQRIWIWLSRVVDSANQRRLLDQLVYSAFITLFTPSDFFLSSYPSHLEYLSSGIPRKTMSAPEHFRVTYNDVHKLIQASAERIAEFKPDMLIAIGEVPRIML